MLANGNVVCKCLKCNVNRLSSSSSWPERNECTYAIHYAEIHVPVQVSLCRSTSTLCNKEHGDDAYTIMIPFRHSHFHLCILFMSSTLAFRLDWRCKWLNFNWLIDKHAFFDWLNKFGLQCWAPLKMRHSHTLIHIQINVELLWSNTNVTKKKKKKIPNKISDNSVQWCVRVSLNTKEKWTKNNKCVCK